MSVIAEIRRWLASGSGQFLLVALVFTAFMGVFLILNYAPWDPEFGPWIDYGARALIAGGWVAALASAAMRYRRQGELHRIAGKTAARPLELIGKFIGLTLFSVWIVMIVLWGFEGSAHRHLRFSILMAAMVAQLCASLAGWYQDRRESAARLSAPPLNEVL